MIKRILSNRMLTRFLRWCFGSLDWLIHEEEQIKDNMLVILTKEDTGEQQRVD